MRRAHRVIVEVTFEQKVTAKLATNVVRECLERGEIDQFGLIKVKEAERVLQAELRNRRRISASSIPPVG